MQIQHTDNGKKGKFFVAQDGVEVAEMTYVWVGDKQFIIDHTEVSETLKGQHVGNQLVAAGVEFAREKQVKVIPLCPFAKHVFDTTAAYRDLL